MASKIIPTTCSALNLEKPVSSLKATKVKVNPGTISGMANVIMQGPSMGRTFSLRKAFFTVSMLAGKGQQAGSWPESRKKAAELLG